MADAGDESPVKVINIWFISPLFFSLFQSASVHAKISFLSNSDHCCYDFSGIDSFAFFLINCLHLVLTGILLKNEAAVGLLTSKEILFLEKFMSY